MSRHADGLGDRLDQSDWMKLAQGFASVVNSIFPSVKLSPPARPCGKLGLTHRQPEIGGQGHLRLNGACFQHQLTGGKEHGVHWASFLWCKWPGSHSRKVLRETGVCRSDRKDSDTDRCEFYF